MPLVIMDKTLYFLFDIISCKPTQASEKGAKDGELSILRFNT